MEKRTRRSILRTGLVVGLAGCLDNEAGAYEAATSDLPPIESTETRRAHVSVAHWFPSDTFAPVSDQLPHGVTGRTATDRASHDAAIADALVAGSPPDLFQTVLGDELRRYQRVREIEPLPGVAAEFEESPIANLAAIDDEMYAVPLTATPINGLLVAESADVHPETVTELVDSAGHVRVAIPRHGARILHLLELVLAGVQGRRAHEELRAGSLGVPALREAVDLVRDLLDHALWVPAEATPRDLDDVDVVLPGPNLVGTILHARWDWLPFPGTDQLGILEATGITRPIRGSHPTAAMELILALCRPGVQQAIADRAVRVPAVAPPDGSAPGLAPLAAQRNDADRLLPALCSGCGLDADRRWRAIEALRPDSVIEMGADRMHARLQEVLLTN